jgi:hypothetical protein
MQELATGKFHFEPPSRFTSLDHLVGAGEQRWRHLEAERPGVPGLGTVIGAIVGAGVGFASSKEKKEER